MRRRLRGIRSSQGIERNVFLELRDCSLVVRVDPLHDLDPLEAPERRDPAAALLHLSRQGHLLPPRQQQPLVGLVVLELTTRGCDNGGRCWLAAGAGNGAGGLYDDAREFGRAFWHRPPGRTVRPAQLVLLLYGMLEARRLWESAFRSH